MTALTFRLHRLDTGHHVGWALVCHDARYAAVAIASITTLQRRFTSVTAWRDVEREIRMGLSPGPLPTASAIAQLLAGAAARSTGCSM